ncbi:FAD-binding monooxygenase [Curtobacterium sp. MCBD17_034]|nr:FAD-binding monooxygenase [Curtobacterium sp. MCBD17_034]PZM34805.1 FAD-binding monooxygenase [Curtobacterium sp. MCBD17_031]
MPGGLETVEQHGRRAGGHADLTTETATVLVRGDGSVRATLPSDGTDGATAELEVLRGDFARVVLDSLPADVTFHHAEQIEHVDDLADSVRVTTRSGRTLGADLLVIAEGVRSTTRDLLFNDVRRDDLGVTMVFGTIPRTDADDDRWRWYNAVHGRQVHLRPDNHGTTRAILAHGRGEDITGLDRDAVMAHLRDRYDDAGWEARRVLDGFAASDDVDVDQLTQIRMPTWHRGRVCLAGDAAWCVTPMGGGGASLALTSGYVLAASLSDPETRTLDDALAAYESWMRPLVVDAP